MKSTYKTQSTHGGDYTPNKPLGAISISIDGRNKEIFIDAYEGQGNTYKLRDKPLINLFNKSILVFSGNTDELFNRFIAPETSDPVTEARELLRTHGYVVDGLWSKDDIKQQAEAMDIELTPEQVDNIFVNMGQFDAEVGINWDFIGNLIQEEVNPIDPSRNIEL